MAETAAHPDDSVFVVFAVVKIAMAILGGSL